MPDRLIGVQCRVCFHEFRVSTSVQGIFPTCPECNAPVAVVPSEKMWAKALRELDSERVDPDLVLAARARAARDARWKQARHFGQLALFAAITLFAVVSVIAVYVHYR